MDQTPTRLERSSVAGRREAALDAAPGMDVRIGGGPSTVRQFLAAALVDVMHLVVVPLVLGRGTSLWEGLADVQRRFDIETIGSTCGLAHQIWNRRRG